MIVWIGSCLFLYLEDVFEFPIVRDSFPHVSAVDKNKGTSITWEAGLWRTQIVWSPTTGSTVFIMTLVKMLDVFKAVHWSKFLCNSVRNIVLGLPYHVQSVELQKCTFNLFFPLLFCTICLFSILNQWATKHPFPLFFPMYSFFIKIPHLRESFFRCLTF